MSLSCPLLFLFVLKLENHLSQELEILYRAWAQKIANTYCYLCFLFFFGWNPPFSLLPPPPPKKKKKKIFFLLQIWFFVKIHLLESSKLEL